MAVIALRPTNLHWIDGSDDDPEDLCAHSGVDFQIDGDVLVRDGDWTVSAAALYLLRTLSKSHTKSDPVADYLFPCCGHAIFEVDGQDHVMILGCNNGIDFEILHIGDHVRITAEDGRQHHVGATDWTNSACEFSDAVRVFYSSSSPKRAEGEYEQRSFEKFLSEWSRRRSMAENRFAGPML
jgi:hypothetical protein